MAGGGRGGWWFLIGGFEGGILGWSLAVQFSWGVWDMGLDLCS